MRSTISGAATVTKPSRTGETAATRGRSTSSKTRAAPTIAASAAAMACGQRRRRVLRER